MKKILLATTILGMTAGFASAEIAFTGAAAAGFAKNGTLNGGAVNPTPATASNVISAYSSLKLSVAATGETDSGLTFGASTSATGGETYDLADDDGFKTESGAFGVPSIFIAGSFGKVTFANNDFDFYDDATGGADVKYEGTFGAVSVGLISDVDNGGYSAKLGYSANGIALSADSDSTNRWNASAAYTMGAVTATLSSNEASVTALKVAYKANGISASVKADNNDDWDVTLGYAANGMSIDVSTDEVSHWTATAGYDLGGGLSLAAGANYTEDLFLGAKMAF